MTKTNSQKDVIKQAVDRSREDPVWFLKNILHQYDLCDPWQVDGLEALADIRRFRLGKPTVINHEGLNRLTFRSCHGPGKTHFLALVLHYWNFCFYGLVVGTAPKQDQIRTRFMPRYRKIRTLAGPAYQQMQTVDVMRVSILGDRDWGYIGETASTPENLAGYHDTRQLFLVDEGSARTLDPMFPAIEGALTTPGSVLVMIGNPTRIQGEFWASHKKRGTKEHYFQFHIKPEDSRYIDMNWVKKMVKKYGPNSPVVKVRVYGDFADIEENQLLALDWLEEARALEFEEDGSIPYKRMTIDVADGGEDETIITIGEIYESRTHFLKMKRFSFPQRTATDDVVTAAERMFEALGMGKATDDIVVDSIGVGTGVASRLITLGYNVIRFKGGSTENIDTKKYRNHRVRCFLVLRDAYVDQTIYYANDFCSEDDWEAYIAQMVTIKTKPGTERVEDLVGKEEMKRNGIKSPDMPDGTSMMFTTMSPIIHDTTQPILLNKMETADASW